MKDNSKFGSSQSLIDAVNEVLRGGQKKLDKNNNGKLDGEDFKKLRGENEVDEVAVSKTQQRAAGAALATQRGEYDGGKKGGAINRMASMKPSDLMKIAGTKTKDLPMRKEESYDLDELSKGTMKSYVKKATTSSNRADAKSGGEEDKAMSTDGNKYPEKQARHTAAAVKAHNTWKKRETGLAMAQNKLRKEEVDLDEAVDFSNHMKNPYHKILDAHGYKHVKSQVVDQGIARHSPHTAHTYNRDGGHIAQVWSYHNGNKPVWHARYKQDNGIMAPGHGETKPALSKYLERRHGSTDLPMRKEEAEQMDELSKSTMGSYIKKAASDVARRRAAGNWASGANKIMDRERGIGKAVDKLTKEEDEQIDELSKSTMGSYIKKAASDVADRVAADADDRSFGAAQKARANKIMDRERRMGKAVDKLTKEDVDLDEAKRDSVTVKPKGKNSRYYIVIKTSNKKSYPVGEELTDDDLSMMQTGGNVKVIYNEDAVTKAIKSIKAMKAKESTNC